MMNLNLEKLAKILENTNDVDAEKLIDDITIQNALVLDKNYILDCPIINNQ